MARLRPVKLAVPIFRIVNVRFVEPPTPTGPNPFVLPLANGVPKGCSTANASTTPVPDRFRVKLPLNGSLERRWSVAVFGPALWGRNWIVKIVLAEAATFE